MLQKQKTDTQLCQVNTHQRKRDKISTNIKEISHKKRPIGFGIGIGILLTLVTITLQCIAFFTPHWKEISPSPHLLHVDGVDALIRKEVSQYFNTFHRSTRHSYGLFRRCEYSLNNSSTSDHRPHLFDLLSNRGPNKCTKNYLPSYRAENFNECHSLPYYRFCTKANEKSFNINNDYLRATFDISISHINSDPKFTCDCHYPPYVQLCHVIGILALIFLFFTSLTFGLFPFCSNSHYRLKIKCFGLLASVLATLLLMFNLIVVSQHLEYESIEYLIAIQRHYKSNQIYKLSEDTKTAIDRFLTSIRIRTGYSAVIAWIAFTLSIIDGILLLATCKTSHNDKQTEGHATLLSSHEKNPPIPVRFTSIPNEDQSLAPPSLPLLSPVTNDFHGKPSHSENHFPSRILIEDEV